jgi:hypothetical protein
MEISWIITAFVVMFIFFGLDFVLLKIRHKMLMQTINKAFDNIIKTLLIIFTFNWFFKNDDDDIES